MVLVAISATAAFLVDRAQNDASWVTHTVEVENQISLTQLQIRRAESAVRGFLLQAEPDYAREFDEADEQFGPILDHLAQLTSDNPVEQRNVVLLRNIAEQRMNLFRKVVQHARTGKIEDSKAMLAVGSSGDEMDRMRDVAVNMRREENRLFEVRTDSSNRSNQLAAAITIAGSLLIALLAIGSILLVRQSSKARDRAEQQLRENNQNLETIVDERTTDLREANQEIQRFAYIVSHDLRSPLVNIMGFTSELEELRNDIFGRIARYSHVATGSPATPPPVGSDIESIELAPEDKQLSEEFAESLGFIKTSIGKMDRLISAILKLTREGRREFTPIPIKMNELVQEIVDGLAHQASEAGAQMTIDPLPDLVSDQLALEQIFSNLVENALKYLRDGIPGQIYVKGRNKLGFAVYDVTDNGRGIDRADHDRIFELFRRAGTQDKPGQGIGLAHVRALVRRLGGTITVSSEPNKGSTFTIALPVRWTLSRQGKENG
ncbi:MAG: CHASE3 domain-containing protein [Xanthobacteraceae bacterium]|nr:CHASE3 domain-containing protein [Xanthobacteraceae bacterium]